MDYWLLAFKKESRMMFGKKTLAVAALLGLSLTARGDDWPQWLGPERDAVWRETGILERFPPGGPVVRWRAKVAAGYAGPAVSEGKVIVTDRVVTAASKPKEQAAKGHGVPGTERVLCFDEKDGKLLWKHEYDCPYSISYDLGPRTTPIIHQHKVYTLGAEGDLLCLDADDGKVIWQKDFKKEYKARAPLWGFSSHPLIDGQKLICLVGGSGSTVVAFDKDTGHEIWRALDAKMIGYCPPVIFQAGGARQLIIWDADSINGLDPETGKVYWTEPIESYMGMSIATPRRLGDMLYITGAQGRSLMLDLDETQPKAKVVWKGDKKKGLNSVFSTPFFEDGYVYGCTGEGELACIKAATGETVWETLAPNNNKKLRTGDLFLIKNGDRFFLATEKGDLIIAKLSPKGYEEISRTHLLEPTATAWGREIVWSHPAFADRCVFARNDKELICVSLAK
jgi:outer membrane protein assembly factor BamB